MDNGENGKRIRLRLSILDFSTNIELKRRQERSYSQQDRRESFPAVEIRMLLGLFDPSRRLVFYSMLAMSSKKLSRYELRTDKRTNWVFPSVAVQVRVERRRVGAREGVERVGEGLSKFSLWRIHSRLFIMSRANATNSFSLEVYFSFTSTSVFRSEIQDSFLHSPENFL